MKVHRRKDRITIDNVVQPTHRRGELSNEKKVKGVLMPLKFQFRTFFEQKKNYLN